MKYKLKNMKIYIVEQIGYDEHEVFGFYSTIELARKKLKLVYDEMLPYHQNCEKYEMELQMINDDLFVFKYQGRVQDEYKVSEVEVISDINDVK